MPCEGPSPSTAALTRSSSCKCYSEMKQGSEEGSDGMFLQK